jgi:hypothetical protein
MASAQAKRITAQRTLHKLNTRKEARAKQLHARCASRPTPDVSNRTVTHREGWGGRAGVLQVESLSWGPVVSSFPSASPARSFRPWAAHGASLGLAGAMFCARRDGRRVSYGFHDNGVDRVDPILRARHRFSGARSAQALADLNRATLLLP